MDLLLLFHQGAKNLLFWAQLNFVIGSACSTFYRGTLKTSGARSIGRSWPLLSDVLTEQNKKPK
jgi:hypothetical protein